MDETEVKYFVEAALLAAGRPLNISQIQDLFDGRSTPDKAVVRKAITDLQDDYAERGIVVAEVASGFRMQVRASMADRLNKLWEERPPRYSRALFETLALIAYRQPMTRGEIEEIRGVAVSSNIVRSLLEREWVRVVGHRDVPGRPAMFGTTRQFLDYFSLKRLEDLPPLADLTDWESLRVQLDLPEVDETEQDDFADIKELPVMPVEGDDEGDDDVDIDPQLLAEAESLADSGFEELVASEWPDPASESDEATNPEASATLPADDPVDNPAEVTAESQEAGTVPEATAESVDVAEPHSRDDADASVGRA